jgi:hypothetical protein
MSFFRDTKPGVPEDERWKVVGNIQVPPTVPGVGKGVSGGVAWATPDGLD